MSELKIIDGYEYIIDDRGAGELGTDYKELAKQLRDDPSRKLDCVPNPKSYISPDITVADCLEALDRAEARHDARVTKS